MALLYLVYGFFVLYVLVQMILRLALIDILLALAPVALGLWTLPHTAGWGRHWLRLFMTIVFQQAVQLIAKSPTPTPPISDRHYPLSALRIDPLSIACASAWWKAARIDPMIASGPTQS